MLKSSGNSGDVQIAWVLFTRLIDGRSSWFGHTRWCFFGVFFLGQRKNGGPDVRSLHHLEKQSKKKERKERRKKRGEEEKRGGKGKGKGVNGRLVGLADMA